MSTRTISGALWALHIGAAVVLALTVVRYLDSPLRADEAEWPPQVHGVLLHGAPRLALDEDARLDWFASTPANEHLGMWHPPLYHYLLAAGVAVAGDHNWTYRGVNLLCLALSLLIAWRIVALTLPDASALVRAAPLSLALLSPLVSDASLFIDIDNSVLTTVMLLFAWRFLVESRRAPSFPGALRRLAPLFALALAAKLTTPFVLLGACGVYALLGPRKVRGAAAVAAVGVAGVAIFAAAYWAYCRALSYPPEFMFDFSYLGKHDLYGSAKNAGAVLFALRWNIVWLSPVLALAILAAVWQRIGAFLESRRREPEDLLFVFAAATFFLYVVVGAMWGNTPLRPLSPRRSGPASCSPAALARPNCGARARCSWRPPAPRWCRSCCRCRESAPPAPWSTPRHTSHDTRSTHATSRCWWSWLPLRPRPSRRRASGLAGRRRPGRACAPSAACWPSAVPLPPRGRYCPATTVVRFGRPWTAASAKRWRFSVRTPMPAPWCWRRKTSAWPRVSATTVSTASCSAEGSRRWPTPRARARSASSWILRCIRWWTTRACWST